METGSFIHQSYLTTNLNDKVDALRYEEHIESLLAFNNINGRDFLAPLNFFLNILDNTHEVMFAYMDDQKRNKSLRDLQATYLLLLTQKRYELEHQKTEHVNVYNDQIKKCMALIDSLNYQRHCQDKNTLPSPEYGYASDGKTVAYTGLYLGRWFANQMVELTEGSANSTTKDIKLKMGAVNEKRLYWVWSSVLLKTMLELLPADYFNTAQAKQTVRTPDPYTGCMSWGLYYFRFSLNLSLLLKHTISGPWMSEVEKKSTWTERFSTQWDQRKFTLLNDFFWATGNILCFFWLVGKGTAGTMGDLLTVALLVFDISLAVWDYEEQKTQHNKEMLDYQTKISALGDNIRDAQGAAIAEYEIQLCALKQARDQCAREWSYQKLTLATNIAYAVGLMLAFVLLTTPFLPLSAGAAAAMSIAGAVLCFAFSVIANSIKGGIEIHKNKAGLIATKQAFNDKIEEFILLLEKNTDRNTSDKKLCFLEIKQLLAETKYQQQSINLQTAKLVRSVMLEALFPALVFASLVFFPLNIGLMALGAVIALAIASHFIIDSIFKTEKDPMEPFNEKEYLNFSNSPDKWVKQQTKQQGFFKAEESLSRSAETDSNADHAVSKP